MEAAIAAPRDSMADCRACESSGWGDWREDAGDDEGALEFWRPVLDGDVSCVEQPHIVLAKALLPMLRTGRLAEARGAHLTGYPMVRHNPDLRNAVGHHLEFCALTGNEARGLEILAEHASWLTEDFHEDWVRLTFLGAVCVLLRRLVALDLGELTAGSDSAAELLARLETEVAALCARFDARYGNTAVSERVTRRLDRKAVVDHLPLGVRAALPRPVPSSEPPSMPEQSTDTAEAATVLVEELAGQPERAGDLVEAALNAAAAWEGVSEPDRLRCICTAARAYHGLERHGEAAALFAEVASELDALYEPAVVSMTREQYGESLQETDRYREAAEQYLMAAQLVQHDPDHRHAHASLAWRAASALESCGENAAAIAAYRRAAELWAEFDAVRPRARCLRSLAWLLFYDEDTDAAVETMRAVLNELEALAETESDEVTPELEVTRRQLEVMLAR